MKQVFFILAFAAVFISCNNANTKKTIGQVDSTVTSSSTEQTIANTDLLGTEWKLLELNGKMIKLDTTFKKEPLLVFEKETEKIIGNGGCNGFMGSYKLKGNNGMELKLGGATMMACPNLEVETQFQDALKQTKSYRIEGNNLFLDNETKAAVAKFAAATK